MHQSCFNNADSIVKTEAFLDLSPIALEILIARDNFSLTNNNECEIHDICVKWARSQLQRRDGTDNATYLQIRDHLGQILYKIRYPNLSHETFANTVGCLDLITESEQNEVYYYISTKEKKKGKLSFDCHSRKIDGFVERYATVNEGPWNITETFDAIQFTIDKTITLSAIGLYTGYQQQDYMTTINI